MYAEFGKQCQNEMIEWIHEDAFIIPIFTLTHIFYTIVNILLVILW